ncbi:hypothetical protein [Actinomadura sp. 6N118]|uniref:hypothetical protein n=1 Tax=Actinomadura sp. 6N118 TaxID=3375151 RepID=UPI0037B4BDD9
MSIVAQRRQDSAESDINDEHVVNGLWSGLRFLARHARDRAATGGTATVRATIQPASPDKPAALCHYRGWGEGDRLGDQVLAEPPESTGVFDVDELAEDGPGLIAAASELATGLVQPFGRPEIIQLSRAGQIRIRYWKHGHNDALQRWAQAANVELTEATLS